MSLWKVWNGGEGKEEDESSETSLPSSGGSRLHSAERSKKLFLFGYWIKNLPRRASPRKEVCPTATLLTIFDPEERTFYASCAALYTGRELNVNSMTLFLLTTSSFPLVDPLQT